MPRVLPPWDAAVEAFLAECRRKNLSPATIEAYRYNLVGGRARTFVAERGITSIADLDADCLRALELGILDAGKSPATAHIFHRVWKTFARFCHDAGWLAEADILTLAGPTMPQREPETFTADEERRLLVAARTPRDRFLVELLMATGVRLREVCALTVDDVMDTPQGPLLKVRQGKGRKDRGIPLDTGKRRFSRRLQAYIREVRPQDTQRRELFLTSRRDGRDYAPLRPHGVYQVLHRIDQATGIHTHPHKFRHTFATRALAAGVDSLVLQRALGHTSLSMVNRYTHMQAGDMLEAWRRRDD